MQSYVIHLVRHGLSQGSLEGRYVGVTDSPLASRGKEELRVLRQKGKYPRVQRVFSSPLLRCRETAAILFPHMRPELLEDFRECSFGDWEGKTAQELTAQAPRFAAWIESGSRVTPPNGESGTAFLHRVCAGFESLVETLLRQGITESALVTHGGVIMGILSAYGLPRAGFYDWMTESGTGYSLRITPGLWMRSMVAEVYGKVPLLPEREEPGEERILVDLAREAADRAYGKPKTKEKP